MTKSDLISRLRILEANLVKIDRINPLYFDFLIDDCIRLLGELRDHTRNFMIIDHTIALLKNESIVDDTLENHKAQCKRLDAIIGGTVTMAEHIARF